MNKKHFPRRHVFRMIAAWMILSLAILACGLGASPDEAPAIEEPAAEEPLPTFSAPEPDNDSPTIIEPETPSATAIPVIPERRRLTLEFPRYMRAGDSDVVRLTLEVDDLGNVVPTAEIEGNVVTGEVVEIPNLYLTHHVVAEAKFDIAGVQVSPSETISQTLSEGQSVTFYWSVHAQDVGNYRGTVWFYLRFVDKVSGEESQKTVSAQLVEIEAVNLFGLLASLVKTVGGVGSVIGSIVGFPFFEDIVKFIFRRRKVRRK